ncbi:MAG: tetratricopeptide repeat protein, partial [Chitinophagales bacterium]
MKQIIFISLLSLLSLTLLAQSERKHVRQGNELYFDGKTDKAIEAYEKALQKAPESPEAHFNMGNAYLKQKDYESASASYQTALGLLEGEGQKAAALHNLGNTYLENQKPKEAKEAYQQALRLNPQDGDTRYNLALANKMLQKQEEEQEQENKDEQDQEEEGEDEQEQDQEQQDKGEDQEEE